MNSSQSRLSCELVAAATAFHSRKLWTDYDNDDCFALVMPEEDHRCSSPSWDKGAKNSG